MQKAFSPVAGAIRLRTLEALKFAGATKLYFPTPRTGGCGEASARTLPDLAAIHQQLLGNKYVALQLYPR